MAETRRYEMSQRSVFVEMPRGAEISRVFVENTDRGDAFFIEAKIDPDAPSVRREIHLYGVRCSTKTRVGGKLIESIPYGTRTWPDIVDVFDFGEIE